MRTSSKLFIAAVIFFVLGVILPRKLMPLTVTLTVLCFVAGFALLIFQGIMEIINKNKAPKKGKDTTPPWEK